MKFILNLLFLIVFVCFIASAQQSHFLFIQSENKLPFNITLNNKVYSSTASGYLIIPKLSNGLYNFRVGFGQNSFPDQKFTCLIEKKDIGFNLKNFGEKGWGLFNLQTYEVTMAGEGKLIPNTSVDSVKVLVDRADNKKTLKETAEKSFEPFKRSDIKEVQNSIAEKTVDTVVHTHKKKLKDPSGSSQQTLLTPASLSRDTMLIMDKLSTTSPNGAKKDSLDQSLVSHAFSNQIVKISELKGSEAIYITYVDSYSNTNDTIQILIPNTKAVLSNSLTDSGGKEQFKFLDMETKTQSNDKSLAKISDDMKESGVPVNGSPTKHLASRCSNQASDEDFFKLRKKMAAVTDDDAMINEAKKFFKIKCFTTLQIKNLSYLFLNDEGRYQFFDSAYPFVSDQAEFPTLSKELTDAYYLNRFKAMLFQ